MELAYKNVYKNENGILIKNTQNKIVYLDHAGKKRTKTNPTYADFAKIGMFRKKYPKSIPEYDHQTQELIEAFEEKDGYWQISYTIKSKENMTDEKNN